MAFERMRIFTGNANPKLAEAVCRHLNISLGRAVVGRFSDGEVMVELLENVRGRDAFVLQSTCAPTNDNLMEVMVMVDALKRASVGARHRGHSVFGYARQDRRPRSARVPITRSRRRHAGDGRRRSRDGDGPARRPDPGLFQHPGRQHLRDTRAARRRVEAQLRQPARRLARRRRRRARTRDREAARQRPRDIDKRRPNIGVLKEARVPLPPPK